MSVKWPNLTSKYHKSSMAFQDMVWPFYRHCIQNYLATEFQTSNLYWESDMWAMLIFYWDFQGKKKLPKTISYLYILVIIIIVNCLSYSMKTLGDLSRSGSSNCMIAMSPGRCLLVTGQLWLLLLQYEVFSNMHDGLQPAVPSLHLSASLSGPSYCSLYSRVIDYFIIASHTLVPHTKWLSAIKSYPNDRHAQFIIVLLLLAGLLYLAFLLQQGLWC